MSALEDAFESGRKSMMRPCPEPTWDDAPEWAKVLGKDALGNWWWSDRPLFLGDTGAIVASGRMLPVMPLTLWPVKERPEFLG